MPPESGGSQFLDTGTAVGLFALTIVLVLKTILPYFVKSKSLNSTGEFRLESIKVLTTAIAKVSETLSIIADQIKDLHRWHAPKTDTDTGQPKFLWYGDWVICKGELQDLKVLLNKVLDSVEEQKKLND